MPLVMCEDGHLDRPTIVCDHCGEVIARADDALGEEPF